MTMENQKNITFSGIINDVRMRWPESTDEEGGRNLRTRKP